MHGPDPRPVLLAVALVAAAGCTPEPTPIVYGTDVCTHCRMGIVDDRYGAELVTQTGLTRTFDSIECMADYVLTMDEPESVHSLWVTSFQHPGELVAVEDAHFLHSEMLRTPMGAGLTAFRKNAITPTALVSSFGGVVMTWDEVVEHVRRNGHVHAVGSMRDSASPRGTHGDSLAPTDAQAR